MPLATYLEQHGVDPAQAAVLGAQGDAIKGGQLAPYDAVRSSSPTPAAAPPASNSVTSEQAVAALGAHNEAQLARELDAAMAPPARAWDYSIPSAAGQPTDEAMAADRALVGLLHAERVPVHIGNAIMIDLQRGAGLRQEPKSAADVAALSPWVNQILARAKADPALKIGDATAEQLLSVLSRETVVALKGFVEYRARPRG